MSLGDVIENLAVWVRIFGSLIDYYDNIMLSYIGNHIGKTMKVDKNKLIKDRGKYVRLCIHVDITKPFLVMFSIKDLH